jgi:hypothetical protein
MIKTSLLSNLAAMLAAVSVAAATAQAAESDLPGVWSLGETRNCATGPAWVFLADGYYVEVKLPDQGPFAAGIWKDEGQAIAYTHSHMPFPDMLKANEMKRLTMVARTAERLDLRNYNGVPRVFHRCSPDALKAPPGQVAH